MRNLISISINLKNDLCDTCEKCKIMNTSDEKYEHHLNLKELVRAHRNADQENKEHLNRLLEKSHKCP